MSTIDYKNMDEWIFNYFEGNLSAHEKDVLKVFLNKNPSLRADFDAWKNSYVQEPVMEYPNINSLLKPQATPGSNRIIGLIALFVLTGLLVFYKMHRNTELKLPAEFLRERSFSQAAGRTQKEPIPFIETERPEQRGKTGHAPAKPLITEIKSLDEKTIQQSGRVHDTQVFIMKSSVIPTDLSYIKPRQDSLEIIINKQEPGPVIKNRYNSKKKKKEMKIIRLTDTGF